MKQLKSANAMKPIRRTLTFETHELTERARAIRTIRRLVIIGALWYVVRLAWWLF